MVFKNEAETKLFINRTRRLLQRGNGVSQQVTLRHEAQELIFFAHNRHMAYAL